MTNPLLEMLARSMSEDDDGAPPRPLPEAQIATLQEMLALYAAPPPFRAGDIVTPRRGGAVRGAGDPHIVLEVSSDASCQWGHEAGSNMWGARPNVRIGCLSGAKGTLSAFWVEHWQLEAYSAAGAAE